MDLWYARLLCGKADATRGVQICEEALSRLDPERDVELVLQFEAERAGGLPFCGKAKEIPAAALAIEAKLHLVVFPICFIEVTGALGVVQPTRVVAYMG